MNNYVDGFVFVVPNSKTEEYKKMAEMGRETWLKCGAIGYYECRGDDMKAKDMGGGAMKSFPELVEANEGETPWFSFVMFKSREHRDEVNAKVMEEMGKHAEEMAGMEMPFDMKRMVYGGFQVEVEGK